MFSGVLYKRKALTIVFSAATIVQILLNTFSDFAVTPTTLPTHTITYYFFVGMMFFQWKEYIPIRWSVFLVASILAFFLQISHHTVYLAPIFVTYCTIFFGMLRIPRLPIISSGDYSYGVYLYGAPIAQAVLASFPSLTGRWMLTWCLAFLSTTAFAALSWHAVEKRCLTLKNLLPARFFPKAERFAELPMERTELVTVASGDDRKHPA
jgi:peptidoglycan/LPS O-acetylase OafA/YrhL